VLMGRVRWRLTWNSVVVRLTTTCTSCSSMPVVVVAVVVVCRTCSWMSQMLMGWAKWRLTWNSVIVRLRTLVVHVSGVRRATIGPRKARTWGPACPASVIIGLTPATLTQEPASSVFYLLTYLSACYLLTYQFTTVINVNLNCCSGHSRGGVTVAHHKFLRLSERCWRIFLTGFLSRNAKCGTVNLFMWRYIEAKLRF